MLGKFEPQMLSAIVCTPKRHFLTLQRVFWAILRKNPCTVDFSRRVWEKIKIKKRLYISPISPGASLTADWHKFWVTYSSRGRNQFCKILS